MLTVKILERTQRVSPMSGHGIVRRTDPHKSKMFKSCYDFLGGPSHDENLRGGGRRRCLFRRRVFMDLSEYNVQPFFAARKRRSPTDRLGGLIICLLHGPAWRRRRTQSRLNRPDGHTKPRQISVAFITQAPQPRLILLQT